MDKKKTQEMIHYCRKVPASLPGLFCRKVPEWTQSQNNDFCSESPGKSRKFPEGHNHNHNHKHNQFPGLLWIKKGFLDIRGSGNLVLHQIFVLSIKHQSLSGALGKRIVARPSNQIILFANKDVIKQEILLTILSVIDENIENT